MHCPIVCPAPQHNTKPRRFLTQSCGEVYAKEGRGGKMAFNLFAKRLGLHLHI